MRRILQVLGRGEAVAMLMDQNFDCHEGVFVEFFGHRACTNKGLALLARHTRAPVVPVFLLREGQTFVAEIGPELPLIRTGDKTKDLEANTQRYNQVIEAVVRRHPEQWFWVHQRWKTRPYHPWPKMEEAGGICCANPVSET
jgi:KDO2-lipid IV(A) lauroyltransferase